MTDTPEPDDGTRQFLHELLSNASGPPPRDVVRHGRWRTAEELRRANAIADTWTLSRPDPEPILDAEGSLIGFGPASEPELTFNAGMTVTRSQLHKAGLTPQDVPNLDVVDDPQPRKGAE